MGKKLDWDKPYGEIIGPHRASYDQDGSFFDSSGNEISIPSSRIWRGYFSVSLNRSKTEGIIKGVLCK